MLVVIKSCFIIPSLCHSDRVKTKAKTKMVVGAIKGKRFEYQFTSTVIDEEGRIAKRLKNREKIDADYFTDAEQDVINCGESLLEEIQ